MRIKYKIGIRRFQNPVADVKEMQMWRQMGPPQSTPSDIPTPIENMVANNIDMNINKKICDERDNRVHIDYRYVYTKQWLDYIACLAESYIK